MRCSSFRNALFLVVLMIGSAMYAGAQNPAQAVDLDTPATLDSVVSQLAAKRVVFIGETHNRYDHHLNQLELIRRLYQTDASLSIGVEYFPKSLQPQVDDYIAGRSTDDQFLRGVDYFRTWGYDYRLYEPIFRFAREHRIPVRALNAPASLTSAVAKVGLAGLSEQQRAELPREIQPADPAYKTRLREAFEEHRAVKPDEFDHFVEAQLVWDETMAASAAEYLRANPGRMVILAGAGHVVFGSGIPSRLERRTHAAYAIVLSSGVEIEPQIADYILLSKKQDLPPGGVLGASLKEEDEECRVGSLDPSGAAEKAGIKKGDVLESVAGKPVKTVNDVRVALWDKKPGERVQVSLRRGHKLGAAARMDIEVELRPGFSRGIPLLR